MLWERHLDDFGRMILQALGIDLILGLPDDYNPITRALLTNSGFVEQHQGLPGFNRSALSRVATICQMAVFDAEGGPEGDNKPKALRRHWYAWYKAKFAQPLASQIGDMAPNAQGILEMNDSAWTQRLSQTYAEFVDGRSGNGQVTYRDLWIEDASRMMAQNWEVLFGGCNIIIAVEKDSLFADFEAPAKALGARSVYSGKGKSSKAAIEKCLREHFNWHPGYNPFTSECPLIILHISDYDFDGEAVIGPTFGNQAQRYTPHILEARVGVEPENVRDAGHAWDEKWYQVKVSNKGYQSWAEGKALFLAECTECGHQWPVVSVYPQTECPICGGTYNWMEIGTDTAHGFEVEALKTHDYYHLLVDALLQVLPFDYIVSRLRDECVASAEETARVLMDEICEVNEDYQQILAEFERLEILKTEFEDQVRDHFTALGDPHISDWRDDDDDPEEGDFQGHVEQASNWSTPWRPFRQGNRTNSLTNWLREDAADDVQEFEEYRIL